MQHLTIALRGFDPKRCKRLANHKREYLLNDDGDIIHRTKILTCSDIESSTLFEFPKYHNLTNNDDKSSAENSPS